MTLEQRAHAHGWDGHLLLLAQPRAEHARRQTLTRWARRGVDHGALFVCAEGPDTASGGAVLRILREAGMDDADATCAGPFAVLPATEFYAPTGPGALLRLAEAEGYGSVRLLGQQQAALSEVSAEEYRLFERELSRICATGRMSALCEYDLSRTTGSQLTEATARHSALHAVNLRTVALDGGLLVAGEVDLDNEHVLAAALRTALREHAAATFWLDLRDVIFFAADGYRAILDASAEFRQAGGEVLLAAPRPSVERVLRLLMDIGSEPNLALA